MKNQSVPFSLNRKQNAICPKTFLMSCALAVWFACGVRIHASEMGTNDAMQQIMQCNEFQEQLIWVGTKNPDEAESSELSEILNHLDQPSWPTGVERFLKNHPDSPWTASLHYNYGSFCRSTGLTTKALENWESAWKLVQNDTSAQGKQLGGTILANWTDLLSSLGRLDKLKELIAVGGQWHFVNPQDRDKFEGAKNSYFLMQAHPEIAYRCGTFALKAVGGRLQPTNQRLARLVEVPSPANGFSMAALVDLSKKYGLDLMAVRRTKGQDLIVPSVVHWRQNHYAAILDFLDGLYLVSDPTFGSEKWIPAEAINEEASGEFLIPPKSRQAGWTKLARNETEKIHGMGLPNSIKDGNDKNCKRNSSGQMVCTHCPTGMPIWWVSEPYINVWIADNPVSYLTSLGEPVNFQISYKQRDTRIASSYVVNPGWNNSWFSYIHMSASHLDSGDFSSSDESLFLPNGGEVDFPHNTVNAVKRKYDPETRLTMMILPAGNDPFLASGGPVNSETGIRGLRVVHPDGAEDIYGDFRRGGLAMGSFPFADFLLTRHIDPNGNTTRFYYTGTGVSLSVQYVVDPDGRTNTLQYTGTGLLSEVDNPYGLKATFKYDANNNLTNIVDAAGLSSTIKYDTNDYPAALITPYGTNQFAVYINPMVADTNNGQGNFGGHNLIDRAVQVTDPVGANYLYLYRSDCSAFMARTYPSSDMPTNTPLDTLDDGNPGTNLLDGICFLNSFYWGPRQYAGISTTNINNLTTNDYLRGRMRHWLEDTNQLNVTGYLSIERDPSPDGSIEGLKTFYDYQGKLSGCNFCAGTNPLPSVKAWRLPSAETHYEYMVFDSFGNITNDITTYTLSTGSIGTRTNQFIYATNIYTFSYGSLLDTNGTMGTIFTTNFVVANLLTKIIGPDGNAIWSYAGFDTITWTNDFYNGTLFGTNRTFLSSLRVLPHYATNGIGQVVTTTFTGYNRITSIKSVAGLTTTNIYNNPTNGFLLKTIDVEIGRTNSFSYTTNGLIGTFTNELGLNIAATWDNLLRLIVVQFPDGTYISNRYDKLDLGGTRDRLGNWTTYGHDRARHLTSITNANNAVTVLTWCGCGALTDIHDPLNNDTSLGYDNQGNLTSVNFPDTSSISYQYDLAARRISAADGAGRTWQLGYNNQGLVTVVSNAHGQVQGVAYDIRDRQIIITNADNVSVADSFDPLDRILTRTWPNGATEGFGYSAQGLAYYTNQLNQVCRYGYDAAMRKTAETNANNEVTMFAYDSANDLLTLKDGKNQTTTWGYDAFGRVTNKLDAANNLLFVYKYDPNSRLTNRTSLAKGATAYKYDAVGNLTNIVYPVSPAIALRYDPLNRLTNMVDAVGTNAFSYNQVGQLTNEDGPWANDTVGYSYAQRLRTALNLSQPGGSWSQSYGYDNARRLTNTTSSAGAFGYEYSVSQPSTLIHQLNLPNGAYITNTYDSLARLTGTSLKNSSGTVLDLETYAYGAGNERTQQVFTAGNFINYGYDMIGQLKSAIGKESGGTTNRLQEQLGYAYDAAGNLNFRTNNALIQTFNVNNLNELTTITNSGTLTVAGTTTVPATGVTVNGSAANHYADATFALGGFTLTNGINSYTAIGTDAVGNTGTNSLTVNLLVTNSYSYDLNGNLTSDGKRGFDYDDENELIRVTVTNNLKKEYVYDGERRLRIRKEFTWISSAWVQTNEIRYVYDGNVVIQHRDTNNVPMLTFTRGLDLAGDLWNAGGIGGLLAMTEGTSTNSYYHNDGLGNVMMLINTNQLMVAKYEYDPFGNPLSISGPKAFVNPYWHSSQLYDPDTGFSHYRFRVYVPELHRWLNRDPIAEYDGINLYQFAWNDPISTIDPLGLYGLSDYETDFGDGWSMVKNGVSSAATSAEEFFTGKPDDFKPDPNSLLALSNQAGVGNTPLTDQNGHCVDATHLIFTGVFLPAITAPLGLEREGAALLTDAAKGGGTLVRFGKDAESIEKLAADAAKASDNGFPHGVSTQLRDWGFRGNRTAPKSEVEKIFNVTQTSSNPNHYTVVLPWPVTQDVVDQFNSLFK